MARRVSKGKILFHVIMTILTGGLWLIALVIWFLLSNSR